MVASLRCNELKEESLELIRPQTQRLRDLSEKQRIPDFTQQSLTLMKQALSHYDEYAH